MANKILKKISSVLSQSYRARGIIDNPFSACRFFIKGVVQKKMNEKFMFRYGQMKFFARPADW